MNPFDQAWALLKGQESKEFFEQYPDISYYQEDVIQHPPYYTPYEQESGGPAPGESEVMRGSRLSGGPFSHLATNDRTAFSRTTMNPQIATILARYARKLPGTAKHPRIPYMRDVLSDTPEEPENYNTYVDHLQGLFASAENVETGEPMDITFQLFKEEDWERYGFEQPPWSALNPAPITTYDEEIEALENAGDTAQARRFVGVKNALARPDEIKQSAIERFGVPISQALSPEWNDDEHMSAASDFYNQGRNASDFADIRNYSPEQQAIMRAEMKKLLAQKKRVGQHQERAEELENQLRIDDPTKFFADKERPFRDPSSLSKPRNKFFNEPNVRPGDVVR